MICLQVCCVRLDKSNTIFVGGAVYVPLPREKPSQRTGHACVDQILKELQSLLVTQEGHFHDFCRRDADEMSTLVLCTVEILAEILISADLNRGNRRI